MASEEIATLLRTARDQLLRAEDDFEEGFFDSCALFSALCAENSASALILALGSKPSKKHRNWYLLKIIPKPKQLEEAVNEVLERLKLTEEHIIRARYPVKDEEGAFMTPSEYYDRPKAETLLQNATEVLKEVESIADAIFEKKE